MKPADTGRPVRERTNQNRESTSGERAIVGGERGDVPTGRSSDRANHAYYFDTGVGRWAGTFGFAMTDWRAFLADSIGLRNRLLVLLMTVATFVPGRMRITSVLEDFPDDAPAGVVTNDVRITKFGVTLYVLRERYLLHPDGRGVTVDSRERFGPVPFLFAVRKAHPAEILDGGRRAVYYLPLLGTDWVGDYRVRNRNRIESTLSCPWAEATEVIERVS